MGEASVTGAMGATADAAFAASGWGIVGGGGSLASVRGTGATTCGATGADTGARCPCHSQKTPKASSSAAPAATQRSEALRCAAAASPRSTAEGNAPDGCKGVG